MKFGGRRLPLLPDPELIRRLARLLAETGLSEIEYSVGACRIRVARSGERAAAPLPAPAAVLAEASPQAAEASLAEHPGAIKSPMVGTAYLAPQPGTPPFVRPGDEVAAGQPLLIIEAMKVMNQIRAPRTGRVERILVRDGEPVEYGAVLMLLA
ncbi:MAG TPA: acetyl-CoA carboxylase biotin carboxyl carrier protein subunit [Stellaceae bacterium]|nr:acetyl-CoA carboxylase biotin carboxyl carrier protein subunit [Stellaceae bacterium]